MSANPNRNFLGTMSMLQRKEHTHDPLLPKFGLTTGVKEINSKN